jgi:hypothetical protein
MAFIPPMKIKVRWLLAVIAVAAVIMALFQPRWRLCSREIRLLAAEERLLRNVAHRVTIALRPVWH